jgi:hypothetical protein
MKQPLNKVTKTNKAQIPSKFIKERKVHINEDEVDAMVEFDQEKALLTKAIPNKRSHDNNYNQFSVFHKLVAVYFAENTRWNGTAHATSVFLCNNPSVGQHVLRKWVNNQFNQQLLRLLAEKYGSNHFLKLIPGFDREGNALPWISKNRLINFNDIDLDIIKAYGFTHLQSRVRKVDELMNCIRNIGKVTINVYVLNVINYITYVYRLSNRTQVLYYYT